MASSTARSPKRRRWISTTGAALVAGLACGGSSGEVVEPSANPRGKEEESETSAPTVRSDDCPLAFEGYVQAWTRWFEVELEDEEAVAEVIAAFREQLPTRAAVQEMRDVAGDLRYEPGFERWLVALTATERAVDVCGAGVRHDALP